VLVDPFRFRIVVVDPKTRAIATEKGANGKRGRQAVYGDYGQSDGMFAYPTGIAYDKTRDWFAVADTYNNRVQIVRLPETGGNVLAPIVGGFRTPMCVFCVPWILLIAAAAVLISRRRRQDKDAEGDAPASDGPPAESDAAPAS